MRAKRSSLYPEQQLRRRAMGWAVKLKVSPEKVLIERLPGKWGSCAPDGVVSFAEDLAKEADEFQDYVIVHELLHLRYRDHGKQFKAMMNALVPNWLELDRRSKHATESVAQAGRELEN
jgi:predicted metal-dependent hydrolase